MRRRAEAPANPVPQPQEPFRTIVADPPWPYGDKLPGKGRGAAKRYATMRVDEIARYLSVDVAKDARLFLWRVAPMQEEALHVMRAWGFGAPVSEVVWAKTMQQDFGIQALMETLINQAIRHDNTASELVARMPEILAIARRLKPGMGRTFRMSHETCLVGRRGRPERLSKSEKSVFYAPVRKHSEKPEEFFELVERLSPGPYLELFSGGHRRPGWTCLGEAHALPA
jgi:N6-adenosine-specific RNA methylase IME4